jgi:GNAT superfamily N-acetyltransferase
MGDAEPRQATAADAGTLAALLHAFNNEFATPTAEPEVVAGRLRAHLPGGGLAGLLVGEPAAGFALLSFRPNASYDGPVALLDELYVRPDARNQRLGTALVAAACDLARSRGSETLEINVDGEDSDARRFYERHGFRNTEPGRDDQLLYYYREL